MKLHENTKNYFLYPVGRGLKCPNFNCGTHALCRSVNELWSAFCFGPLHKIRNKFLANGQLFRILWSGPKENSPITSENSFWEATDCETRFLEKKKIFLFGWSRIFFFSLFFFRKKLERWNVCTVSYYYFFIINLTKTFKNWKDL